MAAPPTDTADSLTPDEDFDGTDVLLLANLDIPALARCQRQFLWLTVILIASLPLAGVLGLMGYPWALATPAILAITAVAAMIRMQLAHHEHAAIIFLTLLLLAIPGANLIAVLVVNAEATRLLRSAGLTVRFLGVSDAAARPLEVNSYCHVCRYDLIGNVSGICPECGAELSPAKLAAIRNRPARIQTE